MTHCGVSFFVTKKWFLGFNTKIICSLKFMPKNIFRFCKVLVVSKI